VTTIEPLALARKAKEALLGKKAEDPVILDVRGLSDITDYYLIVSGNNVPHIKALRSELDRVLEPMGVKSYRRAGEPDSEWVVADYFDVVIHIFSAATRAYYDLERLWSDAKRVT
jgi:ribosome-associated protein